MFSCQHDTHSQLLYIRGEIVPVRILITGAAGFIGSHVADSFLNAGHQVVGIDDLSTGARQNLPANFNLLEGNIQDATLLDKIFREVRPEVICHHAAQVNVRRSWNDPLHDASTNILGSIALLKKTVEYGTEKFIYSSSGGAIYGEPKLLPVPEDHVAQPLSNYGASKYAVELYLKAFNEATNIRYVILRYANIYGPRQDPGGEAGVVAIFATQLLKGERPTIFGNGTKTRDYVYIDDITMANELALDYPKSDVFNLGTGKKTSDLEVFETVRDALDSAIVPRFGERRLGEVEHIHLDITRARDLLHWIPQMEFRQGVQHVVAYWREKLET